ncbi:MAG: 6-hydroxycyclohex-1-ene-1-carbonyl-CoA dehydrogenase [Gammaproteobacteria bacterium]|nr:6-hydroxycyclohex-1-ene-1-carbonyl-CoA dehydrogenase [Gammaproteobacteria bacterium]
MYLVQKLGGIVEIAAHRWMMTEVNQPFSRENFTPDPPEPHEVVVEIAGCGVCHTDLGFLYNGVRTNHPLPLALGHEISGRVVAAGAEAESLLGSAVIVSAVIPCGRCDPCTRSRGNFCRQQSMPGNDIQGGFASHVTVPSNGLCIVEEADLAQVGMELADVSVLADAVTTPYQAALLAQIEPGDLAIVIGVGGVGGYAVQIANAMGATVVAVDIDDATLARFEDYGASLCVNAGSVDDRSLKKQIRAFAAERNLRSSEWKIFECSGTAAGQATAFSLLVHGAHLAIVGFTLSKSEVRLSNLMAFHARMQGNWGCLPEYYPDALRLVLDRQIHMKPFIKHHPLDQINEVFAAAQAHRLDERAILVPGDG